MKIDFSKEHKNKLIYYINEYQKINERYSSYTKEINSLQEELNNLTAKLQSTESDLQSMRDDEKKYMEELHEIYGDFSLNDIWDSLY
jgi:chromosome segregation ATPase